MAQEDAFTKHPRQGDEAMLDKKSNTKFTIQFKRKDPAHIQVAEILNQQERGNKAQYIVDAVMHYVNSGGAREAQLPRSGPLDEEQIEAIVNRILQGRLPNGESISVPIPATQTVGNTQTDNPLAPQIQSASEIHADNEMEILSEECVTAAANALDAFRRN